MILLVVKTYIYFFDRRRLCSNLCSSKRFYVMRVPQRPPPLKKCNLFIHGAPRSSYNLLTAETSGYNVMQYSNMPLNLNLTWC